MLHFFLVYVIISVRDYVNLVEYITERGKKMDKDHPNSSTRDNASVSADNSTKSNEHNSTHHSSSGHHHHRSYYPYGSSSHHSSSHHSSSHRSSHSSSSKKSSSKSKKSRTKYKSKSKKKLIIGAIVSLLILFSIAGYTVYNELILPRMVEPALEQVVSVMQDEKYVSAVTKELRRLYEDGQVSGSDVEKYLQAHDPSVADYMPGAVYTGKSENGSSEEKASSASSGTTGNSSEQKSDNSSAAKSSSTSSSDKSSGGTSKSSLGVNSVNVIDDDDTSTAAGSRYSNSVSHSYDLDTSDTNESEEKKQLSTEDLYAKAKRIMTPSDFSTAMSIGSKIDKCKAKSLINDNDALIAYVQSVLTPDEYSTGLTLYSKYYNELIGD